MFLFINKHEGQSEQRRMSIYSRFRTTRAIFFGVHRGFGGGSDGFDLMVGWGG